MPVALYPATLWVLYEVRHPEVPTRMLGLMAVVLVLATTLALKLGSGHRAATPTEGS